MPSRRPLDRQQHARRYHAWRAIGLSSTRSRQLAAMRLHPISGGGNVNTVVILTSGTTWTVPKDFNVNNNTVEAIGGGGGGSPGNGGGGGGGEYRKIVNFSAAIGASIAIAIGQGGAGGLAPTANGQDATNTTFNTNSVIAVGGKGGSGSGGVGGTGGTGAGGNNNGGTGGVAAAGAGGAGGGAGGPNAVGGTGGNGSASGPTGGTGGNGGGPSGGGGGGPQTNGSAGTGWTDTVSLVTAGAGGGGGGGTNGGAPGAGGLYGAGGGGGTTSFNGGAGQNGVIVITYGSVSITPTVGSLTLTGNSASAIRNNPIIPTAGALALSPLTPSLGRSDTLDLVETFFTSNGRLQVDSFTQVSFQRFAGRYINLVSTFSGTPTLIARLIPAAGWAVTNTGLAASTLYFAYVVENNGAPYLTLSTTKAVQDATFGIWTKTGDSTQALVGCVITDASVHFAGIDNWFNQEDGGIFPLDQSAWTWFNQNGSVVQQSLRRVMLLGATGISGTNLMGRLSGSYPTAPFTLVTVVKPWFPAQGSLCAIGLATSDGTKYKIFVISAFQFSSGGGTMSIELAKYNSATSFNSTTELAGYTFPQTKVWLKLVDDGVNQTFSYSFDGLNYIQVLQEANTTFLTPSNIGIVVVNQSGSNLVGGEILSWDLH